MFTKKKVAIVLASVSAVAMSASAALAVPVLDLTTAATSITGELTPAITAAMPIAGTIIAVNVGWNMFKRFTRG